MENLVDLIGLDVPEFERRMRFFEFADEDRVRLAEISEFVEEIADEMVDRFYDRVLAFPETARFLQEPQLIEHLKFVQRAHFIQLCTGPYEVSYFESRLRVGVSHARIGLSPQWYLGAYLIQMRLVAHRLFQRYGTEPARVESYLGSLWKIVALDIALATDAYIYGGYVDRSAAEVHAYEAERAREALEAKQGEEEKRQELLSMVVHDIRSPVTAMIATARAGLRRFRDRGEPPGKQFDLIESSGQNVLHIIDNIVTHARAPGGDLPLAPEPFNVSDLVRECVDQLLPFAQQTAHTLTARDLEDLPAKRLDRVLVRRVVSNLLVNACRHTPAGGHIVVSSSIPEAGQCRITVTDDGPGLPPQVQTSIFGDGPLPTRKAGAAYVDSGLGLPFCRLACQRMGGSISIEPTGERGTRFVVTLPTD